VKLSTLTVLNALLCVRQHGSNWIQLPERFGDWRPIYARWNRWRRTGAVEQILAEIDVMRDRLWLEKRSLRDNRF
jgi:transposase